MKLIKKLLSLFACKSSNDCQFKSLVGLEGRALTAMLPDGIIAIGFDQYAALSQSGEIAKDAKVVVIGNLGPKLYVRQL